jgi:hypothetical protein
MGGFDFSFSSELRFIKNAIPVKSLHLQKQPEKLKTGLPAALKNVEDVKVKT